MSVIRTLIRRAAAPRPAWPAALLPGRPFRRPGRGRPAWRPARGVPGVQRPGPVTVGARDQALPPAARPAGRDRRQPVAVVDDLHGQGPGPPGRGHAQHQRTRQRRVHGGLEAHCDRAGPRVGDPGKRCPAKVDRARRAVRAHVHDLSADRAGRPGDIHVAAAGPAGRVAAGRQAGVPPAGGTGPARSCPRPGRDRRTRHDPGSRAWQARAWRPARWPSWTRPTPDAPPRPPAPHPPPFCPRPERTRLRPRPERTRRPAVQAGSRFPLASPQRRPSRGP